MRNQYFGQNLQLENGKNEHWILHIRVSLVTKFQLKLTILIFLDQIYLKNVFLVKNGKNEHHHWFLNIQISLDTKFQLKLTTDSLILTFWTNFSQNGYFRSKTEKVDITNEFCILELVCVPHFSLNW